MGMGTLSKLGLGTCTSTSVLPGEFMVVMKYNVHNTPTECAGSGPALSY